MDDDALKRTLKYGAVGAAVGFLLGVKQAPTPAAKPHGGGGGTVPPGPGTGPYVPPAQPGVALPWSEGNFIGSLPLGAQSASQIYNEAITRSAMVLDAVQKGYYDRPGLSTITLDDDAGNEAHLEVWSDALSIEGVRVNAGYAVAQQCADALGVVMQTQKIADQVWRDASVKLIPAPAQAWTQGGYMSSTDAMLKYADIVDAKLSAIAPSWKSSQTLVANIGKDWLLSSKSWLQGYGCSGIQGTPPYIRASVNYGYYKQTSVPASGALTAYAIQPPGFCHDMTHTDYSQTLRYMSDRVYVRRAGSSDFVSMSTADVLMDTTLGRLLNYDGAMPGARHPGVPYAAA